MSHVRARPKRRNHKCAPGSSIVRTAPYERDVPLLTKKKFTKPCGICGESHASPGRPLCPSCSHLWKLYKLAQEAKLGAQALKHRHDIWKAKKRAKEMGWT